RVASEVYNDWGATTAEKNVRSGARGRVLKSVSFEGCDIPPIQTLEDLPRVLATEHDGEVVVCSQRAARRPGAREAEQVMDALEGRLEQLAEEARRVAVTQERMATKFNQQYSDPRPADDATRIGALVQEVIRQNRMPDSTAARASALQM